VSTTPDCEVSPGRYEVTGQQLAETLKDEPPENIQQFDLKKAFPVELAQTPRLPKLADKVWRKVLDEQIAEFGGAYSVVKNSTFVQVWFERIPSGAAKAKLPSIAEKMGKIFQKLRENKDTAEASLDAMFKPRDKETRQAPQLSPELTRLLQHGLTPNPPVSLMDLWLTRTMQAILHNPQATPFAKDIMDIVAKEAIAYQPVWLAPSELLVGAYPVVKNPVTLAQQTQAEPMRQDLIGLFATCFQMTALATKGIQSLGFVSLRVSTISNKNALDLMIAFLRRVDEKIRKNLMLEIKALPQGGLSLSARSNLETLGTLAKALMLDTGPHSKEDFKTITKLHAVGFDAAASNLPELETMAMVRKYADTWKSRPQKLYLKGIASPTMIKVAKECGFMYLSGTAVHAAERFCTGVRPFPIRL